MLRTIAVMLLALWLLGLVSSYTMGGVIHVLPVGGVVLMVYGINATNSFGSDVSRFFTGSPTDKAIWMLLGGIIATFVGLVLTLRNWKRA